MIILLGLPLVPVVLAWRILKLAARATAWIACVTLSLVLLALAACLGTNGSALRGTVRRDVLPLALRRRRAAPAEDDVEPVIPPVEPVAPVVEPVTPVVEPVTPVVEPVTPVVEPVVVRPAAVFHAPLLGWSAATGEEIRWHPAGPGQTVLQNGHTEVWGSSGMGKTQFVMSLLTQLAHQSGSQFGIADFKNDYSSESGFPEMTGADFLDLWNGGAPYNPLALDEGSVGRAIDTAVIETRDVVAEAATAFGRLGRRQRTKLETYLTRAYGLHESEGRWPTLRDLNGYLDADLDGVMGDLTKHELFRDGPPLGTVIDRNVVFGLSKIPGNGQTTVLAAGFILSSLLQRVQNLPPVPNSIRYVTVIDEAHRISPFRAVQTMIREGRSKGLAVILATQQPGDLPEVVAANAQTKICFGLPDAAAAAAAAHKLDPDSPRLAEEIRALGPGEAFVSFAGRRPVRARMAQAWRDQEVL